MTTKAAGGKITGILALTMEAQDALAVGDPVHMTGTDDYECEKADGSKPIVGFCSVANVKRSTTTGFYPVANSPGDVTVEARGFMVRTFKSSGALASGIAVGIDNAGKLAAVGAGVAEIGILLMTSAGADEDLDVLCR